MIEHNGESFNPIEKLDELFGDSETSYEIIDNTFTEINHKSPINSMVKYKMPNVNCYPYFIVEKLHEWNFNVFSLPEEEYIKVTKEFNPYK